MNTSQIPEDADHQVIPDAAVEAAAKALWLASPLSRTHNTWEFLDAEGRLEVSFRAYAKQALEAAMPHIAGHMADLALTADALRSDLKDAMALSLEDAATRIVAHLEECGGDYDLKYSTSIRRLADDLVGEIARG